MSSRITWLIRGIPPPRLTGKYFKARCRRWKKLVGAEEEMEKILFKAVSGMWYDAIDLS